MRIAFPILKRFRLPVASFRPSKDQRRTVNKWNDYVLGDEYKKAAAKLHPISKECVIRPSCDLAHLTLPQGESSIEEQF
jgi:hypothetical protein